VSLFESHTAIVPRGAAHLPAEFGRKIMLDEVDCGVITRYAVVPVNPLDAPQLPTSLAHHQQCFERVPAVLAADRAFFTLEIHQLAHDLRIGSIAPPQQGPLDASSVRSDTASRFAEPTAGELGSRAVSAMYEVLHSHRRHVEYVVIAEPPSDDGPRPR
jgi:hypothetical protein